jgi:actin-like ATPase involved in cell morphogenesis
MSDKVEKKEEFKFKPSCGVDIGTANICVCRQKEDGRFVNRFHRNMLYEMDINDDSTELLERSEYFFIKTNEKYYIVGEDALNLVSAIGKGNIIRCMENGIINPSLKESSDLLFYIIKAVVGDPVIPHEPLRFSIPARPIDRDMDNLFHKMVLQGFFTKMGYDAKDVNESLALIYDCNPKMINNGKETSLTGIGISMGAGCVNCTLALKGLSLVEFSCTKSGDFIDESVSMATGVQKSKVIKIKERELNLDKINTSDRVQVALGIYYDEFLSRIVHNISNQFKDKNSEMDGDIEIVIGGGTSMVPGVCKRFENIIRKSNIPFRIFQVRHSETPFYSVSQGSCIRAAADYMKLKK